MKTVLKITMCILAFIGVVFIFLFLMGYRPVKIKDVALEWNAVGSIAEWVGGLAIPIGIFIVDRRLIKRVQETKVEIVSKTEEMFNDYRSEIDEKTRHENIWFCPHCHQTTLHSGVKCNNCGYMDCE